MVDAVNGQGKATGHVFISYVREDRERVDRLEDALTAEGIRVWRDTNDLWPGQDWRENIRRAITDDALVFVACFSQRSLGKVKSYQNEELLLAIEQLRRRRPDHPWLIPVRFDDCRIPDRDLGPGRTLASLERADLFGDRYDVDIKRLIVSIQRILGHDTPPTAKPVPPRTSQPTEAIRPRDSGNRRAQRGTPRAAGREPPAQARELGLSPLTPPTPFPAQPTGAAPRETDLTVQEYATKGPEFLARVPPSFADESYRRLARAAVQARKLEAVKELVRISQSQRHALGEIAWLSLAARLGDPSSRALAEAYRRAGAEDEAKHHMILAWMEGDDDAGAEVISYPEGLRKQIISDKVESTFEKVREEAAENGSEIAKLGLGQLAIAKGDYRGAVRLLRGSAENGNPEAMHLLGTSLLKTKWRKPGRRWLRRAGEKGNRDAKLDFARTSMTPGAMRALLGETVSDFDAGRLDVADPAGLLLDLASSALDRGLRSGAVECLRRAASLGNTAAMVQLCALCLDRYELPEAEEQLAAALNAGVDRAGQRDLMFRLAGELARAQRDEAAQRWLEEAARAGHQKAIEVSAGLGSLPARPRRMLRQAGDQPHLPRHFNLVSAIAQSLYLRNLAGIIFLFAALAAAPGGIVFIIWEAVSPITNSAWGTAGYIILGIVAIPVGLVMLAIASVILSQD